MKFAAIVLIGVSAVLVSCGPQATKAGRSQGGKGATATTSSGVKAYNSIDGLLTYLPEEKQDAKTVFKNSGSTLAVGEQITIHDKTESGVISVGGGKYQDVTMQLITNSAGKEVWANPRYLVPNGTLGVVVSNSAVIYSKPNDFSPTNSILPRLTVVAVYPQKESSKYVEITAWDDRKEVGGPRAMVYLKEADLTSAPSDVQSALLLTVASKKSDLIVKRELLKNALSFSNSVFADDVRKALAELPAESGARTGSSPQSGAPVATTQTAPQVKSVPISMEAAVNDNNVNIRNAPTTEGSRVVGVANRGDAISVTARTSRSYTIGGQTAPWYHIDRPTEGWIFGAFVTPRLGHD